MKCLFGEVDGNSWESFCHRYLRLHFHGDGYQIVEAKFGGDLGIESFTRGGTAFQMYCPDEPETPKELYEHQRDKISKDINKLLKNGSQLAGILGSITIGKWIFLTPKYEHKELLSHCQVKIAEVRSKKLAHIDPSFDILVHTDEDYLAAVRVVLEATRTKISIDAPVIPPSALDGWKSTEPKFYENLSSKIKKLIKDPARVEHYVDNNLRNFMVGQAIADRIKHVHPDQYRAFLRVKDAEEQEVRLLSGLNNDPSAHLRDTLRRYESNLQKTLKLVEESSVKRLALEGPADWLMNCPMDF